MLATVLRAIGALCLVAAAAWLFLALPGEPAGWHADRLAVGATCAAIGLLWFAAARALELLDQIAEQARATTAALQALRPLPEAPPRGPVPPLPSRIGPPPPAPG